MANKRRILFFPQPVDYILLSKVAAQSIAAGIGYVKILLDTVIDVYGGFTFNSGSNDVTVGVTGIYHVSFSARWTIAAGLGHRGGALFVNGINSISQNYGVTQTTPPRDVLGGSLVRLLAGDVCDLRLQQSSGAALSVQAISGVSPTLGIFRVSS